MPKIARKYATTTEAEIRALTAQGLTFVQIAEKLNVHINSLRQAASLLGIRSGYGARGRETVPADVWIDRLAMGDTLDEIAASDDTTRQNVHQHLFRRGLPTTCRAAVKFKALQASKQTGA